MIPRVTFLAGALGKGGAERQLFHMICALRDIGAAPMVLTFTSGEEWESRIRSAGIRVFSVAGPGGRLGRVNRIVRQILGTPTGIIQSQHFFANVYVAAAARIAGVSDIGALRGNGYSDLDDAGRIGSFLNLKSPRVIAANSHAGIEAAIRLGARAERMRYLPNVVDTDEFSPRDSMRGAGVCLLAAGRLVREKRVDRFLNLLARVRAEGGPGITGLVAGSGPLREELLVHAQRAGLYPEAIEFRDLAPPQMKTAYWDADVLVVTSESEGTPNVILEGMSAALPAIATDVGGVSEVVLEGRTGYVVPNYDEDLMVSRVIALAQDRTKRCEMGWNGRTFIEESRALKRLPEILGHLYSSVAH